jgi:acetyltransferase-like isoleucine patch superfamily enzyme
MTSPGAALDRMRDLLWRLSYHRGPAVMSAIRKRWIVFRHPHATIEFGEHVYVGPGFSLHIPERGTFIAGAGSEFRRGFRAEIAGAGRVVVGAQSVFTYYALVQCTTTIEFGERCVVAQSALVTDGNHRFRDPSLPMNAQGYDFEAVHIGDEAVIFSKATVTSSVGEHAVVGANAVVTQPVEPYTLVAGVPARVVERLDRAPGDSVASGG